MPDESTSDVLGPSYRVHQLHRLSIKYTNINVCLSVEDEIIWWGGDSDGVNDVKIERWIGWGMGA